MNARKVVLTTALLMLSALPVFSQAVQGPTILLTPNYGSQSIVSGASVLATKPGFDWLAAIGNTTYWWNYHVTTPGYSGEFRVIWATKDWLWFWISAEVSGMTSIRIQGPGIDEVIPLTIPVAVPHIRAEGLYKDFRTPREVRWTNGFTFGPNMGIADLALFGSDFGTIADWVVTFTQGATVFEVPAKLEPFSPLYRTDYLYFPVLHLAPGGWMVQVSALNNPALVSNSILITIN